MACRSVTHVRSFSLLALVIDIYILFFSLFVIHQVWNRVAQSYTQHDKYKGREIRTDEFRSMLASFFHDGDHLMVYHIPSILQQLYALARIVSRLVGYRFYGCSLLFIYDGDEDAQDAFRACMNERPSSRSKRGESVDRHSARPVVQSGEQRTLRRSHSEDVISASVDKPSSPGKRKRGEVKIRVVDFAHTTTGRDYYPYPENFDPNANMAEGVTSGKGYHADVDPESGLIYARFPPKYPLQPDRGFLFGLKNIAEILERIWNEERMRRMKLSRLEPSAVAARLPPVNTDGKEIFDSLFGPPSEEDLGMLST